LLKMSFLPCFSFFLKCLGNCISSSFCLCWQPESAMWSSQPEVPGTFLNHLATVKDGWSSFWVSHQVQLDQLLHQPSKKSNKPHRAHSQLVPRLSPSEKLKKMEYFQLWSRYFRKWYTHLFAQGWHLYNHEHFISLGFL
jgi:hypothetical protein